ncbi:hypothetical protein [Azorhizobium caulinodans]|uniref:hypothetical protein n=1 Tax=Azorhizobium caulinodans TaxID=7 RepID=UPI002FBE7991
MDDLKERIERLAQIGAELRRDAEASVPPDIQEFGIRHGIPNFAEATWVAGYYAALRASSDRIASLEAEVERLDTLLRRKWCLSCGTVSSDGECDCTRHTDLPDMRRPVDYAAEVLKECRAAEARATTSYAEGAEAMREACAQAAYNAPLYTVSFKPDVSGLMLPGSPYDQGRYDSRQAISALPIPPRSTEKEG